MKKFLSPPDEVSQRLRQLRHNTGRSSATFHDVLTRIADALERRPDSAKQHAENLDLIATWTIATPIAEELRSLAGKLRAR